MGFLEAIDKTGHVTQQPYVWAGVAGLLALDGRRGRRAALRGAVAYAIAAVVANMIIKPMVRRPRPPEARRRLIGPVTTSFPSGHAATDLAFTFTAAQEVPALFVPLSCATLAAHWSLVRTHGHYFSDVFFGGALGIGVAVGMWRFWPLRHSRDQALPEEQHSFASRR